RSKVTQHPQFKIIDIGVVERIWIRRRENRDITFVAVVDHFAAVATQQCKLRTSPSFKPPKVSVYVRERISKCFIDVSRSLLAEHPTIPILPSFPVNDDVTDFNQDRTEYCTQEFFMRLRLQCV